MGRICHAHCPARVGVPWVLVLVAAGVWAVAQLLIAAGKTTLVVILGTALVAVGTTVAVAVCGAIRNLGTATPAGRSVAEPAPEQTPVKEPTPEASPSSPPCERPSARPRLRLVRDEEAA